MNSPLDEDIHRALSFILFLLMFSLFWSAVEDLHNVWKNPAMYQRFYGFSGSETLWLHRSQSNYMLATSLFLGVALAGSVIAGAAFWKGGRWRVVLYSLSVTWLIVVIIRFSFF